MKKNKLYIEWVCDTRVNLVSRELLGKMKEAGCKAIWFGVESGSPRILKRINRNITLEQTETAFKLCREQGIQIACSFMLGFPDETNEDLKATLRFAKKLDPDWCQFNIFIAYPDSSLYQELLQTGNYERLDDFLLSVKTDDFNYTSLLEIQRRFLKEVNRTPKSILRRIRREGVLNFVKRRLTSSSPKNAGMA
jgi:radical SAM superfamily enzyme YgiQ (UPF0313 family)